MVALSLRMTQEPRADLALVMTPQVRLSLDVLQMPVLKLKVHLEQELLANPVLSLTAAVQANSSALPPSLDSFELLDVPADSDSHGESVATEIPSTRTWRDQLRLDLGCAIRSRSVLRAAQALVDYLNGDGLLEISLEKIAEYEGLALEMVTQAHEVLQELAEPGMGAASLRECLMKQATALRPRQPLAERILRCHYDSFLKGHWPELQRDLGVTSTELAKAVQVLRGLTPRPTRGLRDDQVTPVAVADVTVSLTGRGYSARINHELLPMLRLDEEYVRLASCSSEAPLRDYLRQRLQEAKWLMKAVDERRQTMSTMMRELMLIQREFIIRGPEYALPLTRRSLAERMEVHESTVSRAVQGKWIRSPRGY